jgi:hypothetical protein
MIPKILITTMYCGEAEYDLCLKTINEQIDVNVTHFLVENEPEHKAHNEIFTMWNNSRKDFDFLVKIDADTILCSNDILKKIATKFAENPRLTGLQLYLYDYFTETNILGLTCLKNTIEIILSKDPLKPDRGGEWKHDIVLRGEQVPDILPAGLHCVNPSNLQAFHYGLHRFLKNQTDKILLTANAWMKHQDEARRYALLGAMASVDFKSTLANFSYTDAEFIKSFSKFNSFSKHQQEDIVKLFLTAWKSYQF